MGSATYLCKYLDKEAQKAVPEGFVNFGRFWGNSRTLVPAPITVTIEDVDLAAPVDPLTGEVSGGSSCSGSGSLDTSLD